MKQIALIGLIFLFYKSHCQNINPLFSKKEYERQIIQKAKIKKSTTYYFKYKKDNLVHPGTIHETNSYDIYGRELVTAYYENNILSTIFVNKYDSAGNKLENIFLEGDSSINIKTTYKYDKNGRNTEIKYIDWKHDWIGYKILHEYDSIGNLISTTNYDREKDTFLFKDKTINFYNNFSKKIKREVYDNTNLLINWTEYKYDTNGIILAKLMLWTDNSIGYEDYWKYDSVEYTIEHKYNKKGVISEHKVSKYSNTNNLLEETIYDAQDHVKTITKLKYNAQDKETDWFLFDNKMKMLKHSKTFYDINNNSSEWILYDVKEKVVSKYSYLFDIYGNKFEEISYDDNLKPTRLIKIIYEYY